VVENPEKELRCLLQNPDDPEMLARFEMLLSQEEETVKESIRNRKEEFQRRYGVLFTERKVALIAHHVVEKGYDVNTVFEEVAEVHQKVEKFSKDFERKLGVFLRFEEEAIDRITEIALKEGLEETTIFSRLAKDYEYGLGLIRDKTGQNEFVIKKEAVDDAEGYLNRMIREIYSGQSDQRFQGKR
jgi:hypothetical protein